ncbi:MAG: outer membrane lipoprotein-sorting protein, partial [Rhodobacteraceae bacterium]|nr:outer membrane lipoprotein-sorting protein [Paracoccaceae bacterium]
VTESVPLTTGSGYSRQLIWHDTETFRRWKVEYYDRKNAHLKTLAYDNYNQYGDFWRAGELNMVNHLTGKGTVMHWNNFDFDTRLNERDFSQTALRRAR